MTAIHFLAATAINVLFAVAIALGLASSVFYQAEKELAVEMTVKYLGGADHTIEIALVNKDNKMIECLEARLPWTHRYSMTLILVKTDAPREQVNAGTPPIDDPSAAIVKLLPKQVLKGSIKLKDRFPSIDNVLSSSGIDVFFAFELLSVDGKSSKRIGGWLGISRSASKVKS